MDALLYGLGYAFSDVLTGVRYLLMNLKPSVSLKEARIRVMRVPLSTGRNPSHFRFAPGPKVTVTYPSHRADRDSESPMLWTMVRLLFRSSLPGRHCMHRPSGRTTSECVAGGPAAAAGWRDWLGD